MQEEEAGQATKELARKHGITGHTIYRWKAKYGPMDVNQARGPRELEDENRRLERLVTDLTLDNRALKAAIEEEW